MLNKDCNNRRSAFKASYVSKVDWNGRGHLIHVLARESSFPCPSFSLEKVAETSEAVATLEKFIPFICCQLFCETAASLLRDYNDQALSHVAEQVSLSTSPV